MIRSLRARLAVPGGLQLLVGVAAIGWGLDMLQRAAEARAAMIEAQAETIAAQEARLVELARAYHPSQRPCPDAGYPATEDTDPLGRGEA